MGSAEVLEAVYPLLLRRGRPDYIRSDNGPEFTAALFQDWLRRFGIQPIRIYPGSPWENRSRLSNVRVGVGRPAHRRTRYRPSICTRRNWPALRRP